MSKTLDARGLACPQPVVLTNRELAGAGRLTVIVDNAVAVENVTRLAQSKGFSVQVSQKADGLYLDIHPAQGAPSAETPDPPVAAAILPGVALAPVIFVPSNLLGRGPEELGERLMGAFFHSLLEIEVLPKAVIFMNSGVKLVTQGSRALDDIRVLADRGVDILACGTCLNYFGLESAHAVGRVSNMYDIATILTGAENLVAL